MKATYIKRHVWTDDEVALLTRYPHEETKGLAAEIGVSTDHLHTKAHALGLRKTHEFLRELAVKLAKRAPESARRTQFQKGNVPWNKGIPFRPLGRSVDTQFKPRNKPHSYAPIGSERDNAGYLQRKMADTGYPPKDWICVHHLVWMAAGHPKPKPSQALIFKDGNKRNFALENLELLDRSELMRRNSIFRYGHEIATLSTLTGALKRAINRRTHQT